MWNYSDRYSVQLFEYPNNIQNTKYQILFAIEKIGIPNANATIRSNYLIVFKYRTIHHTLILNWPNWWPGVTRMEVLSCTYPVPGFQGGTVRHTAVTKMEKIRHGFGHYYSYTFYPICDKNGNKWHWHITSWY